MNKGMREREMEEKITKNSQVEVCSEEEGFADAWFRGVLEENPTKSGRKKLRVRYMTLLDEDGFSPLFENIEPRFIRPVPPEDEYKGVVFEEGLMVDADHKDGWWTGVLIKKLGNDKFRVYYDNPPDIIEFQRNQLRPHLRWTGWKWVRPEIQELDKSMFSCGTMVEVSTVIEKEEVAWFPAMIVKEIKVDDEVKKFIVKDCNKYLSFNGDAARTNTTVDSYRVRPTPPPFPADSYMLLDRVEVFRGSVWRQGLIRVILDENRYMVSLASTKQETVSKLSDLRPCKVWEDGVWQDGPKSTFQQNPVRETPSSVIKTKPIRSCSGAKSVTPKRTTKHIKRSLNLEDNDETLTEAETEAATRELRTKRANDVTNDNTPRAITRQAKPIASVKPVTPSRVRTATPLKQTEADTRGKTSPKKTPEPMSKKNGLKNATQQKMLEEKSIEDKGIKRKREEIQNADLEETDESCNGPIAEINDTRTICTDADVDDQPLAAWISSPTELPFDHSPVVVNNAVAATDVEETQGNNTLMSLPFAKKSPFWKAYETVPQIPHFGPLSEAKEDIREYAAVGMMVTFYGLLDEVNHLQPDVSSCTLRSLSCSFEELEKYGFDVAAPQSRINKMVSLQDGIAMKEEERKCLEKTIEAGEMEGQKYEEELFELECKIVELKRQQVVTKEKKEAANKRTVEKKSCAETIEQEIEDFKLEFETTASAPW